MTGRRLQIYMLLAERGPMRCSQICAALGIDDRYAVASPLSRLKQAGWVENEGRMHSAVPRNQILSWIYADDRDIEAAEHAIPWEGKLPTKLQRDLHSFIFHRGIASARECGEFSGHASNSTLKRMLEAGLVEEQKIGNAFAYTTTVHPARLVALHIKELFPETVLV